ncbi:TonB-dependent receptor [Dasania marina]|uniref:TonB-dependent receptor n=1 Tax=Dasania marina TaxID=471499 RepID=UPI0030DB0F39|tara:strand:- start:66927 stop:69335 length:2409 start_codon:yes stop_codon:yes gene_type:complete
MAQSILKRSALATAVGVISAASAMPAYSANLLEEVTVTATRRAESTMDVPYNISATTSDALEQQGITDFSKLARSVAGLTYVDSGPREAGINSGLIIRGLSSGGDPSSDTASLASPTVSVYIGETPLFVNLHLKDIERVEVLRGPQGTLYGSGSLGGTIRHIPVKPDPSEFSAEVGTRLSTTDEASGVNSDTYAIVNLPLGDSVALRAVAGYVENQGYIDANNLQRLDANGQPLLQGGFFNPAAATQNSRKKDSNGDNVKHVRLSALWDVSDSLQLLLTHQQQEDEADGRAAAGAEAFGGGDLAHANRYLEPLERELSLTALDVEWDMGFATLTSSSSNYTNESSVLSDQSGLYVNADFWAAYYAIGPRDSVYGDYPQKTEAFAQELRMVSNSDGPINWVAGAFYQKQKQNNETNDISPGFWDYMGFPAGWGPGYASTDQLAAVGIVKDQIYKQIQKTEFTDQALFGEISYQFNDAWQATLGMRAFEQEYLSTGTIYLPQCGVACSNDNVSPLGLTGGSIKKTFNDQIFKFNVSYNINEDMMAYATWAEGFRHGGTNGIPTSDVTPNAPFAEAAALAGYESDLATNWEAGIKGTLMDGSVRFSAAGFFIEWQDIQIDAASPVGAFPVIVNGETAESKGVELELMMAVTESLTATVGYAYTDAQLSDDFAAGGVAGFDGDSLPGVPDHAGSLSFNYLQPINQNLELSYNLNGSFISSTKTALNKQDPNYSETAGYALWDASVILQAEQWSATLFVDNLANKQNYSYGRGAFYNNTVDNAQAGRDLYSFVNRPRTIGLGFKYKF